MTLYELIRDGFWYIKRGTSITDYLAKIQKNGVSDKNAAIIKAVLRNGKNGVK